MSSTEIGTSGFLASPTESISILRVTSTPKLISYFKLCGELEYGAVVTKEHLTISDGKLGRRD